MKIINIDFQDFVHVFMHVSIYALVTKLIITPIYIQRSPFSDMGRSLLKTMTMTTGEFDYDTLFRVDSTGGSDKLHEIVYPPISYIMWIAFIVLMPIVLMNMLVRKAGHLETEMLIVYNDKFSIATRLIINIFNHSKEGDGLSESLYIHHGYYMLYVLFSCSII